MHKTQKLMSSSRLCQKVLQSQFGRLIHLTWLYKYIKKFLEMAKK